jgi:hypothetical protein
MTTLKHTLTPPPDLPEVIIMRVLVGILYSGESEFNASLASASRQKEVAIETFIITDKPNKIAHDELYETFMTRAKYFDFFLKLDADMTLRHEYCVRDLLRSVTSEKAAHALSYVYDSPSSLAIPGVQIFRSDSKWEGSTDTLNVDYLPKLFGKSILITEPIFVDHMPAPSDYQLFRYGIHKTLKAIQHGRGSGKSIQKGLLHISIMNGIARNYFSGHHNLIWALIGSILVFNGHVPHQGYHSDQVKLIFENLKTNSSLLDKISRESERAFSNEIQTWYRWVGQFQST